MMDKFVKVMPYLEDTDMAALSSKVIGKLRDMPGEEFGCLERIEAE